MFSYPIQIYVLENDDKELMKDLINTKTECGRCLHTEEKTGQLSHHLVHISTSSAALGEADYLDDKDTKCMVG